MESYNINTDIFLICILWRFYKGWAVPVFGMNHANVKGRMAIVRNESMGAKLNWTNLSVH